jgi:hypothetical protein
LLTRTPLRVGTATVWADPRSGTVRFGVLRRARTLLAGLDPTSYLIAREGSTIVATVGSSEALSFSVERGASAAIATLAKPGWCVAVEAILPEPLDEVYSWLEVGVRVDPTNWYCSIPLGRLPWFQARLTQKGHQLTYITRIQVADHDGS